jgi:predicted transcriptional regulator
VRSFEKLGLGIQINEEAWMSNKENDVIEMAADIVSAYVAHNSVSANDLPNFIRQVHDALQGIRTGAPETPPAPQAPAVSVRKSISPDFLICLEDGRKFKSLKRHLRTQYNMTPEAYRAKWGLPRDYPMVAPNYAASRSALAKSMGLGQGSRKPAKAAAAAKAPTVRKPRAK